jgi:uncharacterized coiled-coil DUF342 family protein
VNAAAAEQPDEREPLFTEIAQLREERADLMRQLSEVREELRKEQTAHAETKARLEDQP